MTPRIDWVAVFAWSVIGGVCLSLLLGTAAFVALVFFGPKKPAPDTYEDDVIRRWRAPLVIPAYIALRMALDAKSRIHTVDVNTETGVCVLALDSVRVAGLALHVIGIIETVMRRLNAPCPLDELWREPDGDDCADVTETEPRGDA